LLAVDRIAATRAEEQQAAELRTARIEQLIVGFDTSICGVLQNLGAAATQLDSTANTMTDLADGTNRQACSSADGASQATANVQTVAASAEELAASLREISYQVGRSNQVIHQATDEARTTDASVCELTESVNRIGEVIQLISSIASKTNLLALNATIEAARAGEAGRGFVVVADEVKGLANQTGRATEEIAKQIAAIEASTGKAVEAIRRISSAIESVSEVSSGIAAAVEEQTTAVSEISRSASDTAYHTLQVSDSVATLKRMSGDAGDAAGQVLAAAGNVAQQSDTLRNEIGEFLENIRAA
jgi:methyl-accepting chemotaxis protein